MKNVNLYFENGNKCLNVPESNQALNTEYESVHTSKSDIQADCFQ